MSKKLLIVQVAALAHELDIEGLKSHVVQSVFPALTCTVQASFRTASSPARHGMIANGLFYRNLNRPMFWEQSAGLVRGRRIWHDFRARGKRVAMLFWQQSLGEDVDIVLSPAPIHKHHGGMIQDCYGWPHDLYERLCGRIGRSFHLNRYWGPLASSKVGDWISSATMEVLKDPELAPDLCFTYLPTLDYDFQRHDPISSRESERARAKLEEQLSTLVKGAGKLGCDVLIFGDYCIGSVTRAVFPNHALREVGLMKTRAIKGMAYPDFYRSRAFAVVDHEIAHVYIPDSEDIPEVKQRFMEVPGVGEILDIDGQSEVDLNHPNSGELVLIAEEGYWFAYPWWTRKGEAPDFAGHVDIHNKPGYDPCELYFGWPPGSVSQNTHRIKGSHGRIGKGRDVMWSATFSIPESPGSIVDLANSIRRRLDAEE